MNIPIIKLEVESMRYTIRQCLAQHEAMMSAEIQSAVDSYCTPENIQYIIDAEVKTCIDLAVKEEVRRMFSRSEPGRKAIREAVEEFMERVWGTL